MLADGINEVFNRLNNLKNMSFLPGVSEAEIIAFEFGNNCEFPQAFKDWLSVSDGGELYLPAGIQLYGVAHKPLIDVDEDDRPNSDYIVVGTLSNGDPILCEKNSEQISIYNHDAGRIEEDETYPDFVSFLKELPEILGLEA